MCCSLKNVATSQLGSVVKCSDIVDRLQKFAIFQNHHKFLKISHYKKTSWFSFSFYYLLLQDEELQKQVDDVLSFQDKMHAYEFHCKTFVGMPL